MKRSGMVEEVLRWYDDWSVHSKIKFRHCNKEDLVKYNYSLGMKIRNHFKLWEQEHKLETVDIDATIPNYLIEPVDISLSHPDSISMIVIEDVWKTVNSKRT